MGYDPRYSDPTGRTYFYVVLTSSKWVFCKYDSAKHCLQNKFSFLAKQSNFFKIVCLQFQE
jgi:hypothetical protein